MTWLPIDDYATQSGLPKSIVENQVREGKLLARKFDNRWYIRSSTDALDKAPWFQADHPQTQLPNQHASQNNLGEVVAFSSKALNHYLILSEKLMEEKDLRLKEREEELKEKKQSLSELEAYAKMLEKEIQRITKKPERQSY